MVKKFIYIMVLITASCSLAPVKPEHNALLNDVPEDTLIFFGSLEPYPYKDILVSAPNIYKLIHPSLFEVIADQSPADPVMDPLWRFLIEYASDLQEPLTLLQRWGLPERGHYVVYTNAGIPVIRYQLNDAAAFGERLDRLEQTTGLFSKQSRYKNTRLRRYTLGNDTIAFPIVLGYDDRVATVTFDTDVPENHLDVALGYAQPKHSIDREALLKLARQHKLLKSSVGVIYTGKIHQQLFKDKSARIHTVLNALRRHAPQVVELLLSDRCERSYAILTEKWSDPAFGYTVIDVQGPQKILENVNSVFTNKPSWYASLRSAQTALPGFVDNKNAILSMGVGVDIKAVTALDFDEDYNNCVFTPLNELAANFITPEIMPMVNQFDSLLGAAVSVIDFNVAITDSFRLSELHAIAAIKSRSPRAFMAKLNAMGIPIVLKPGMPVQQIPIPFIPSPVNLFMKDGYIVAYTGSKAKPLADALTETGGPGTTSYLALNYTPLITKLLALKNLFTAIDPRLVDYLENLKGLHLDVEFLERFTKDGYATRTRVTYN